MNRQKRAVGPIVVVDGMEKVIKKDLQRHKDILERTYREIISYREARSHEVKKKKHYNSLIGNSKYNDDALRESIKQININIQHFSNKVKLSQDKIDHETLIVDTLSAQLEEQERLLKVLAEHRKKEANASAN